MNVTHGPFPRSVTVVLAMLLFVLSWSYYGHSSSPSPQGERRDPVAESTRILGFVDQPADEALQASQLTISGWALDRQGIAQIQVLVGDNPPEALRHGVPRPDVAVAHPDYPDSDRAGFEGFVSLAGLAAGMHVVNVVAVNRDGEQRTLARKQVWVVDGLRTPLAHPAPEQVFHILFATSAASAGGAAEIGKTYAPFVSSTIKVGMRVPILYLRTTRGRAEDWIFDPDFDTSRRCGDKILVEDNLNATIRHAVEQQLPVLFTLNGGVWADARCDDPEWDVNDALEQDPDNCQWNERNEVLPDNYLKNLPGSEGAPELARTLTFNVYAGRVRDYKRRNLQQAGRIVARFASEYPHLFVGINLDPDLYLNPFVESPKRWYDYNPDTLRQFRQWLQGSGVYAGKAGGGLPDLSAYRRADPLSLDAVSRLSGRSLASWGDVDPPRNFPTTIRPFWRDPWVRQWELFRRHLIDLHYDELSRWLGEAGINAKYIFSSQGFMAPREPIMPFAVRLDSETKNYDTGGMSVEGSVPANGHLGAIIYGGASVNQVRMESGAGSLFATFRALDPGWGVVEYNTADFSAPDALPGFMQGYRSLRDIFNYGARFVSPMAWNGSNGAFAGQPGFVSFTSVRNTPLEDAIKAFMASHRDLPRGARLWTFGSAGRADDDGWLVARGDGGVTGRGMQLGAKVGERRIEVQSPPELALSLDTARTVSMRGDLGDVAEIRLWGRIGASAPWTLLTEDVVEDFGGGAPRRELQITLPVRAIARIDQLRVEWSFRKEGGRAELRELSVQ